ncbi:S8 family serine peptidase [Goodfellowiella coeruleoviolacea]|nr:S8 family serine peptidase [Goodfellowiella coeruleoviolacea]
MPTTTRLLALTAVLALCAPGGSAAAGPPGGVPAGAAGERGYLVRVRPEVAPESVAGVLGVRPRFVYRTALTGFAASLTPAQAEQARGAAGVVGVEPDAVVGVAQAPAARRRVGPAVASWGLDRIDQRDLPLTGTFTVGHDGAPVSVYVIDTGVEVGHAEFGGRAAVGVDVVGDGRAGADCHGHGTHVAGTVGGATAGVARRVRVVGVRALGCDGRGSWAGLVAALDWVAGHAVAPAVAVVGVAGVPGSVVVDAAADAVAARGVFVVVAAGDEGTPACTASPGRAAGVLTVGSTTRQDGDAEQSNYGGCVQLLAPGVQIVSARVGGGLGVMSGTAVAAGHVAGVAALYKQAHGEVDQAGLRAWLFDQASVDRIRHPAPTADTVNRLLHTGGL